MFHYEAGFLPDRALMTERVNFLISSSSGAFHTPANISGNSYNDINKQFEKNGV